jgi:CheY-like chemotaxis protein
MTRPVLLAVDDDPEVLNAIGRDLRARFAAEYRIVRARSGAEALQTTRELRQRGRVIKDGERLRGWTAERDPFPFEPTAGLGHGQHGTRVPPYTCGTAAAPAPGAARCRTASSSAHSSKNAVLARTGPWLDNGGRRAYVNEPAVPGHLHRAASCRRDSGAGRIPQ